MAASQACIEALFQIEGGDGRRKTIEMIRVLKGAINISKSRTDQLNGVSATDQTREIIYHYNRHQKKNLARTLTKYDRDTRRSRIDIECQKRDTLRKWSLVFGKQRNFSESIRGFDDMLCQAIELREYQAANRVDTPEEEEEVELTDEEKAELAEERRRAILAAIQDPRERRAMVMKMNAERAAASTGMLPKINTNTGMTGVGRSETKAEKADRLALEEKEELKRKSRELPRFDRALVKDYLKEQKHVHADLLTRNALMKIKSQADHDHAFFKYRMKTKLPSSASTLLTQLETDRPLDPDSRSMTRQSARSEGDPSRSCMTDRPNTRGSTGMRSDMQTRGTRRSFDGFPSRLPPSRHSTKSNRINDKFSLNCVTNREEQITPKMVERSKTVHFS